MRDRKGVTILELVVALVIGGVLVGIVFNTFGDLQARTGVRSAESNFRSLHAQARASSIERGEIVRLTVDSGGNRVSVVGGPSGDPETLRTVDFRDSFGTELESRPTTFELCMTPRGFADVGCNSFTGEARIIFRRGGAETGLAILPLGQLAE